jgi:hypothetical protein
MINTLPMTIEFIHVKSHQDKDTEVHLLPWNAQMNVCTDHLATDFLDNYAEASKIIPFIRPSQASLTIQGETITRRFANRLRQAASGPPLRERIIIRNHWTAETFTSINWEAPGKALDTLEHSTQIVIIKFAHGHLPTRKHMLRIGEAETDKCPACIHNMEDEWHILTCAKREEWRATLIKNLTDLLHITKTQPDLTLILLQGIRGALQDQQYQMDNTNREPRFKYLIDA